ncbi:ubiquinol-cytochrome c reductase iron-sulfur subunit [Gemmatimonadota bacterium]
MVSSENDPAGGEKSRRRFLETALGTGLLGLAAAIFYPAWRFVFPSKHVRVAEQAVSAGFVDDYLPNSGNLFRFGEEAALLIRTPDGEFRAFLGTCTHLGCNVEYRADMSLIWCACHDGRFDLTGKNIMGPPPRPLQSLTVQVRENEILVSRST